MTTLVNISNYVKYRVNVMQKQATKQYMGLRLLFTKTRQSAFSHCVHSAREQCRKKERVEHKE